MHQNRREIYKQGQEIRTPPLTATHRICDYSDTDYASFWEQHDRQYEDAVERIALRRLTKDLRGSCLEVGGGYGRLTNEYASRCTSVLLTDYAEAHVDQARHRFKQLGLSNVSCETADLYDLSRYLESFNQLVCIRVLHHVEDVPAFFRQVNLVLREDGQFIFEYANKCNLLEILRYLSGKPNLQPFDRQPSSRGNGVYYNFHPIYIREQLRQSGFAVEEELAVSLFRSTLLKRIFGHRLLSCLEHLLQKPLARFHPGPSVFIRARKTRNISE